MFAIGSPKFTAKQVESIRQDYANGQTTVHIGRVHNVSYQAIVDIVQGKSYSKCGGPIEGNTAMRGTRAHSAKLTEAKVIRIRDNRSRGVTLAKLAKEYGVSEAVISRAAQGLSWRHITDYAPPFRLTKNGVAWMIKRLRRDFPDQAFITPAAFIETLDGSQAWFSRMCDAGKLKTTVRNGVRMVRMRDAERFVRDEYGHL